MANTYKLKVPVDSKWLEETITARMTFKDAAKAMECSKSTIKLGLDTEMMSIETVFKLSILLKVNPRMFADFSEYDFYLSMYQ